MNSSLGILFLLLLFTPTPLPLPLYFRLPCPFALATPVRGPPLPLDWMDQRPTHTHKTLSPLPPSFTPLPSLPHLKEHPPPWEVPLDCGPATHEHRSAAGCFRRKRDETVVRVPGGRVGRPRVCPRRPLIYSWLLPA